MRSALPSNVPTRCDQLFSGSVGPSTQRSWFPAAVRTRNFATPDSRRSMYWLFTQPFRVFSKMPPFCPAAVGRTQASTETVLVRSRTAGGVTVIAGPEPGNVAAVSPLIAPGCPKVTPASTAAERPLPLASAALVLPAGSPKRQNPLGWSVSTCWVGPPTSMAPSAQLVTWPLVLQLPWLGVAAPATRPEPSVTCTVPALARAGPLLLSAIWYVSVSPTFAGSGETEPASARSARDELIVLSKLTVLFERSGSLSAPVADAVVRNVPAAVAVAFNRTETTPPR